MSVNCPICSKAGLPDYRIAPTTCPQCNSDLRPFLLLNTIEKEKATRRIWLVSGGVVLVCCVLALIYFSLVRQKNAIKSTPEPPVALLDSIKKLQTVITKLSIEQKPQEVVIPYKVRRGDYPAKIAAFFFNDWKMYKKIEADNHIKQPCVLRVNQMLLIKLK